MRHVLALLMLILHGVFVLLLLHRHASFSYCVNHRGRSGPSARIPAYLGYPYNSALVCTFDKAKGDFLYNKCQEVAFAKHIPPYCLLNQALEIPYRIVLGIIIFLAVVSLSCYPVLTHTILSRL